MTSRCGSTPDSRDWYQEPLYYDIVFDADTPAEAEFLQAAHERYGLTRGRRMLEPACGSGRLVAAMARRGYSVTGLDLSIPMLDFARNRLKKRKLKARIVEGRMEECAFTQKYDAAQNGEREARSPHECFGVR